MPMDDLLIMLTAVSLITLVEIVGVRGTVALVERIAVDILLHLVPHPIGAGGHVELVKRLTILSVIVPCDFVKLVGSKATINRRTSVQIMRPD